ncbi:MAG TPA: VCBS repeat-containing protein [Acidimicrobiales bacterium]|nr:VCBS repeat-containing protein [Acidimicrobiales bacterium]
MRTTSRPTRRRRGLAAALALTAGLVASTVHATPASALDVPGDALVFAPTSALTNLVWRAGTTSTFAVGGPYSQSLAGNFDGAAGGDLFIYRPGSGQDYIQHLTKTGSTTSSTLKPETVSGSFKPFVGDFDGNGVDDVFWYAPGASPDYLWLFDASGAHMTVRKSVGGTYRPIVVDANGDGRDDVIWYAPGTASDAMWLFGPGATHTSKGVAIGGSYTTAVGVFGLEDEGDPAEGVVFYNPSGPDYLWNFDSAANHSSFALPNVDGNYQLLPGQYLEETYGSLLYYGPGSLPERLFAFGPGPGPDIAVQDAPSIAGTYVIRAGDFNADGLTDLSLTTNPTTRIWYFDGGKPASTTSFANSPNILGGPTVVPMGS